MKLNELLAAQVEAIREFLPALKMCRAHGGRFDVAEMEALSVAVPAVFVALLSVKAVNEHGDGAVDVVGQFAAYILTADSGSFSRDVAARNLVEALCGWLPDNHFDVWLAGVPKAIAANNLYSGQARGKAVALWAVTWEQAIGLVGATSMSLVLPEHLYVQGEEIE